MPKASLTPTISAIESAIPSLQFDIDPESAQWAYSLKVRPYDTYGGRVIQVLSRSIDGLKIKGHLPCRHGLDATEYESQFGNMERFERDIKAVMEWQAENKRPHYFRFDALDWSGRVWVKGVGPFTYRPDIAAVEYSVDFEVESGFEDIARSVGTHGLENVPDGVNWVRNIYNTPTYKDWDHFLSALTRILSDSGSYSSSTVELLQSLYDSISESVSAEDAVEDGESTVNAPDSSNGPGGSAQAIAQTEGNGLVSSGE